MTVQPRRDLLRCQLDRDTRNAKSLTSRLARWLASDVRTLSRLRLELERCRLSHIHEVSRLRTVLERGLTKVPPTEPATEGASSGKPKIV